MKVSQYKLNPYRQEELPIDDHSFLIVEVGGQTFRLSESGGMLRIHNTDGLAIDVGGDSVVFLRSRNPH